MATSEPNVWSGPLRPRLRVETDALHRALEERLDLLGPGLTHPRYRRVLGAFHGWFAQIEERLPAAYPPGLPPPRWSERLAADLRALGLSADAIRTLPRCRALPRLDLPAHLAGCLYVLEGSALGGRVIATELQRRLGLHPQNGACFFAGEGAATGARWQRFVAWLEAQPATGVDGDGIVAAAQETFRTFGAWLELRGALR